MEQLWTQSHHTEPHPPSLKPGPGGSVTVHYSDLNPARPTHIERVHPLPLKFSILHIPAPFQPLIAALISRRSDNTE